MSFCYRGYRHYGKCRIGNF
ncbi:MAG: hypothetical protein IKP81_07440 [Paludibacteraceae bacterium]|nr:hypothetical protein [Paludibacteraceae bacterium]MBR6104875.1 hypothetical protein [Paludibacteraceae bacterium]